MLAKYSSPQAFLPFSTCKKHFLRAACLSSYLSTTVFSLCNRDTELFLSCRIADAQVNDTGFFYQLGKKTYVNKGDIIFVMQKELDIKRPEH